MFIAFIIDLIETIYSATILINLAFKAFINSAVHNLTISCLKGCIPAKVTLPRVAIVELETIHIAALFSLT